MAFRQIAAFCESWGCGWASFKTRTEQLPSTLPYPLLPACLFTLACLGQFWLWSALQRIKWMPLIISSMLNSSNLILSPPNLVPGIQLASQPNRHEKHNRGQGRRWRGVMVVFGKIWQSLWAEALSSHFNSVVHSSTRPGLLICELGIITLTDKVVRIQQMAHCW